mmetsp:Transcript_30677/g.56792  ORF Transcript_30677/g.56792 Transcript_30677/m.56792 type:complete len:85 (+) Transcript_30677:1116-1370(+)
MMTLPLFSGLSFALPRFGRHDDDRRTTERMDKDGVEWKAKVLLQSKPNRSEFTNMTFSGNLLRIILIGRRCYQSLLLVCYDMCR